MPSDANPPVDPLSGVSEEQRDNLIRQLFAGQFPAEAPAKSPNPNPPKSPNVDDLPLPQEPAMPANPANGSKTNPMLGSYELLHGLGKGGMGEVLLARHVLLNRLVAIKVLPPKLLNQHLLGRFRNETQQLARLDHANVVRATDGGENDELHYLVMDYVRGVDLDRLSQHHQQRQLQLSVADVCALMHGAATGLAHAHGQNLVHRDIKPSNIMLSHEGVVKVLDFGLILLLGNPGHLTEMVQVLGTRSFMSPEQFLNAHQVDSRADIYSLGVTCFALLTGTTPKAGQRIETLRDVPPELAALIHQMLEPNPAHRPQSCAEVATGLEPFTSQADLPALWGRYMADAPTTVTLPISPELVAKLTGANLRPSKEQVQAKVRSWFEQHQTMDRTIRKLAAAAAHYYNHDWLDLIPDLIQEFLTQLTTAGMVIGDPVHLQLIELLKEGLPKAFASSLHHHLLTNLRPDALLSPEIVVLLRGVGKVEREDQVAARQFFAGIIDPASPEYQPALAPRLSQCPLFLYTLGQLQRKTRELAAALVTLKNAWALLQQLPHGCEPCQLGPRCHHNGLPLEIARGLAVIYRSMAKRDLALHWFTIARDALPNTPSGEARADFNYSFGYFQLEWAYGATDELYKQRITDARTLFAQAEQEFPEWVAPASRRMMCEHLLWGASESFEPHDICLTYRQVEQRCQHAPGEAQLSRYLCALGAWIIALQDNQLALVESAGFLPLKLRHGLANALAQTIFPIGPRQCHAFDAKFLVETERTHPFDKTSLQPLINLMLDMGTWKDLAYARFILAELQSLVPGRRGEQISLQTIELWGANALKLTSRVEDEQLEEAEEVARQITECLDRLRSLAQTGPLARKP